MSERIPIAEYGDLAARTDLSRKEIDAVVRVLNESDAPVLVLEDWLVDEKDIQPVEGEERVYQAGIEHATDKAWRAVQGETGEWVPKSCSLVFDRANGIGEISTPSKTLSDFAAERGEL